MIVFVNLMSALCELFILVKAKKLKACYRLIAIYVITLV
jgi:hypothetical protein